MKKQQFTLEDLKGFNGMMFDKQTADSFKRFFKEIKSPQKPDYQREIQQIKEVLKITQDAFSEEKVRLDNLFKSKITSLEDKLKRLTELAEKEEAKKKSAKNKVLLLTSNSIIDKIKVLFADSKFEFFCLNDITDNKQLTNMSHIFIEVLHEDTSSVNLYRTVQAATINYPDVKLTPISIPEHISELKDSIVISTIKTVLGSQNGNN
jgi:hypothetical protein